MRRHITLTFLGTTLILFVALSYSEGFIQAEVVPSEISPGDAFLVKVCRERSSLIESQPAEVTDPQPAEVTDPQPAEVTDPQPAEVADPLPHGMLAEKPFYFTNASEECFIAVSALGMDARPGQYAIELKDGRDEMELKLTVKDVRFPTVNINLPPEKVFLSPENLKRVQAEDKKLSMIWQTVSDRLWDGGFILPLENDILTSFGTKRIINKERVSVHRGIDIRGKEADRVRASNYGKVVLAEELFFGGNTIIIDHGMGIYTIYMHLSGFNVKQEDVVLKGDVIGFVGQTGRATGPHLHFGVKVLDINANPVSVMKLLP